MKIGDKVRFLNDVGGGEIVGFQGRDIAGLTFPHLLKNALW